MEKSIIKSKGRPQINRIEGGILVSEGSKYTSDNKDGVISLLPPCFATMDLYEIYCLEGDLFEDTERFDTLEEAETRIKELYDIQS